MEIEHSKNKKTVAGILVVIMLFTVFLSSEQAFAEDPVLTLNKTAVVMHIGKVETLVASTNMEEPVEWSSANTAVANVDGVGKVTALSAGKTVITATAGESKASCTINVILEQPAKITTQSLGIHAVRVSWTKVKGATGYQLYRATSRNGSYARVKTLSGTTYVNTGRITGKAYYYKVRAYHSNSYSAFTGASVGKAIPATPKVKLKSGEIKMKISWKKVAGANGYKIYRATKKNGKYKGIKHIKKGKTTSYINKYLLSGKQYYYKVRAYRVVKGKKVYSASSTVVGKKAGKTKLKYNKKHRFYYKKRITAKAYAYTGGGRTAIGTRARVGEIAVDPRVIPLRSKTYVEGYGYARAEDTGGNIKGKTIDVYKNSSSACQKWGVRYKKVYIGVKKVN